MANTDLSTITLAQAKVELEQRVYKAALYLEELEHAGAVYGNGHHIAQRIAHSATNELVQRWVADIPEETNAPE